MNELDLWKEGRFAFAMVLKNEVSEATFAAILTELRAAMAEDPEYLNLTDAPSVLESLEAANTNV